MPSVGDGSLLLKLSDGSEHLRHKGMRSVDEKRGEVKGLTEVVGFGDAVAV
jgi:hypothetical protein